VPPRRAAVGREPRPRVAGSDALWTAAAFASAALFCLVYGWREIFSPDIGFHLATGRDIVAGGRIPDVDTLTWTRAGQPNVNLWWLYQTLLWLGWSAGGSAALVVGHLLVTLGALALALLRTRERLGRLPASCAALLLLFALGNLWETRPHVASWLYLSLVLWLLERDAEGRAGGAIWLLPAIFLLWINTHALFTLGFVALGAHGVDRLLGRNVRPGFTRLLAVGVVSLAACLLNPFHLRGLLLPLQQLGILHGSLFVSPDVGIAEYRALFDFSGFRQGEESVWLQPQLFALLYAGLCVVSVASGWRRLRWSERLLLVAFGSLLVSATRNFGFFFLVSLPAVALGLDELGRRSRRRAPSAVWAALGLALALLALDGRLFAWQWVPHRIGTSFNAAILPVAACRFMADRRIEGRLLNSWDDGGYIAFATGQKTFIDGRMEVMGEALFREYVKLKDPATLAASAARFGFDVVLVPHVRIPLWLFYFSQQRRWPIVYADESWALLLRPGLRPDLPALDVAALLPERERPALTGAQIRSLLEAEEHERAPGLREAWRGRDAFPIHAVRWSGFLFQSGHPDAAAAVGLAALRETPFASPDLLLNVGHALLRTGDVDAARRAFDLFIRRSRVPADVAEVRRLRDRLPR
jgi:hypothetical protein